MRKVPASPDSRDAPDVQPPLHPIAPTTNLRPPSPPTTSPVSGAFANYIASNAWHTTGSVSSKVSAIHQRAAAHATVRLTVGESYSTAGPACQFLYPPNVPSRVPLVEELGFCQWGCCAVAMRRSCRRPVGSESGCRAGTCRLRESRLLYKAWVGGIPVSHERAGAFAFPGMFLLS